MSITLEELDGKYEIHSERVSGGTTLPDGDGVTEIKNGLTFRKDKNGFIWESSFTLKGDKVQMESTIDPSHADKYLKDEKGNLTKAMLTYRALLEPSRENGRLVLKGDVSHAGEVTRLTMTKVAVTKA